MNDFKKFFLLLLCLLGTFDLYAQRKDTDAKISITNAQLCRDRIVTGHAHLRILYAFNAENLHDKNTWIDEGQLKIGNGRSQYSSHFVEVNEDSLVNWLNTHPKANAFPPARWLQGYKPDEWIEYQYSTIEVENDTLVEYATMPSAIESENLKYSELLPLQTWELFDEEKEICGYLCQKAICHWRGRDYTAWFSQDIPISSGPWKFSGLPGLIMKVEDSTGNYSWEATEVRQGDFQFYKARGSSYKKSTREKVLKLQRALNENYFKTTNTTVILYKTGQPMSSRKHTYTPLELE